LSKFSGILFLALVVGLAVSIEKLFELSGQNRELVTTNQKQVDKIKNLQDGIQKVHQQEQTQMLAEQTTVEGLKAKLKQEQDALSAAVDRLRADRNQGGSGNDASVLQDKLNQQKALVQDLESSLRGVQVQEKALNQQGSQTLQQYGQNQRQTDADAKAQIQAQQDTLKELQSQANPLKNRIDNNSVVNYRNLQTQIAQQKLLVDQLKSQRAQANQEYNSAKIGTSAQVGQQKQDLKASEQDLQSRLATEKSNLAKMQKDVQGGAASKKARQDEINSAQADYEAKKAAVQETSAQLQVETQKLNGLAN
jgi:chromosome segregation ATPase